MFRKIGLCFMIGNQLPFGSIRQILKTKGRKNFLRAKVPSNRKPWSPWTGARKGRIVNAKRPWEQIPIFGWAKAEVR
jgi:hypothetical protein